MELSGQQPSDPYSPTPNTEGHRPGTPTLSSSGGSSGKERGPVLGVERQGEEIERDGKVPPELLIQLDEMSLERSQAFKATLEQTDYVSDTSSSFDTDVSPIFFK